MHVARVFEIATETFYFVYLYHCDNDVKKKTA